MAGTFRLFLSLVLSVFYLALFSPAVALSHGGPAPKTAVYCSVPEIKTFSLQQKDVIAIAVEESLPAAAVDNPALYMVKPLFTQKVTVSKLEVVLSGAAAAAPLKELMPGGKLTKYFSGAHVQRITVENIGNNRLRISAIYPGTVKPQVYTIKRKQISNTDNTITFRTYVVLAFSNGAAATGSRVIVLDPGHGGSAPGTVNNNLCEKDLNLDIALLAREIFLERGYDVYMTRTDDSAADLLDRADAANILNADVFISVHNNSAPADLPAQAQKLCRGTTVLYNSSALRPAKGLAMLMCDGLAGALRIPKYPVQDRHDLVVLNATWVPAVLAEVAMLSHPQDAKIISQRIYRQRAAEAIVAATESYFYFEYHHANRCFLVY